MTPPASPLAELVPALRDLHQALLNETRIEYERGHGPVGGTGQLLHLVLHDPAFAWLRVMSELMVDLDELLDEKEPPDDAEEAAIRREVEEMFSPGAPQQFWDRCSPLLQAPDVVMAYGRVRGLLTRLPRADAVKPADHVHAQHRWAIARTKRGPS